MNALKLAGSILVVLAGMVAISATGPTMPQPQISLTSQISDTNQTQTATAANSLTIFAGQIWSMTNCVLKDADGYTYGGTNYTVVITVGNRDEELRSWSVYGDGSTNYSGYDGAWTASTSYWVRGVYIPITFTNQVYMQIKVQDQTGASFIYPLRRIPYSIPLQ